MAGPLESFWRTLTRYDAEKIQPEIAIRNTVGFTLALVLGTVLDSPSTGVVAGTGALNMCYSDSRDPYPIRGRRLLLSSALCGLAVTLGAISGHSNLTAVLAATAWAFGAGMLVALGQRPGDLGVITLVTLVVFAARALSVRDAIGAGLVAFAGGLIQTALALAMWPFRRYEPERQILASLYESLAKLARNPSPPTKAPPVSGQIADAQETLKAALGSRTRGHDEEAERYIFLLTQAERIRLSVLNLGRFYRRLLRDPQGSDAAEALRAALTGAGAALDSIAQSAAQGRSGGDLTAFQAAVEECRAIHDEERAPFLAALLRGTRHGLNVLGGQLRAAATATATATHDEERREPFRRRFSSRLARIEANLSLDSTIFRHALRMAICLGIGDALGRSLSVQRTYWIPMTIAIVLKPDFTSTVSRGVLRLAGTFAGLLVATVLFHFLHTGVVTDLALLAVSILVLRWVGAANYGIFVTALSAMVVLLLATTGTPPKDVIDSRAVNTAIGGVLAMLAYIAWPTWERTQVGTVLAEMLESYREYFRAVIGAYLGGPMSAIDAVRVRGRRARSNAEASVDRIAAEPGTDPAFAEALNVVLANSHRFVHAVMALESGLHQTRHSPPRQATSRFADKADLMLYLLADSFRKGKPLNRMGLPDLREAHGEILAEPGEVSARHSLVDFETDLIATSLNTLAERASRIRLSGA
jgi:uncharacterized membrane protein YccC